MKHLQLRAPCACWGRAAAAHQAGKQAGNSALPAASRASRCRPEQAAGKGEAPTATRSYPETFSNRHLPDHPLAGSGLQPQRCPPTAASALLPHAPVTATNWSRAVPRTPPGVLQGTRVFLPRGCRTPAGRGGSSRPPSSCPHRTPLPRCSTGTPSGPGAAQHHISLPAFPSRVPASGECNEGTGLEKKRAVLYQSTTALARKRGTERGGLLASLPPLADLPLPLPLRSRLFSHGSQTNTTWEHKARTKRFWRPSGWRRQDRRILQRVQLTRPSVSEQQNKFH